MENSDCKLSILGPKKAIVQVHRAGPLVNQNECKEAGWQTGQTGKAWQIILEAEGRRAKVGGGRRGADAQRDTRRKKPEFGID